MHRAIYSLMSQEWTHLVWILSRNSSSQCLVTEQMLFYYQQMLFATSVHVMTTLFTCCLMASWLSSSTLRRWKRHLLIVEQASPVTVQTIFATSLRYWTARLLWSTVNRVVSACFFHLRCLRKLRRPSFSSRRCTDTEQPSAAYHICSVTSCLLPSLEDTLLRTLLPVITVVVPAKWHCHLWTR